MRAVAYSIWWSGFILELTLLVRAAFSNLLSIYPSFYAYVFFVLLQSIVRLFVYRYYSFTTYKYVFWSTEFLGVAIGCFVVFEIYRVGLASYPGTARLARRLLGIVFALAIAKALVDASNDSRWWVEVTTIDVERAVRTVQALAIAALITLFLIYAVPFGRNLKGILLGYGIYIGASVLGYTIAQHDDEVFGRLWDVLSPASYGFALLLWVVYLWAPQAHPEATSLRMEEQYQQVAARTRRRLQQARGYLRKAANP